MATITEDYVSFEVAKLLNVKGFKGEFHKHYWGYEAGKEFLTESSFNPEYDYPAPTLQMAMKWLREVHNLFIEIVVGETEGKTWYDYDIIPINGKVIYWKELDVPPPVIECNTPEEAIEIGLKYCLENLI